MLMFIVLTLAIKSNLKPHFMGHKALSNSIALIFTNGICFNFLVIGSLSCHNEENSLALARVKLSTRYSQR